MTDVAKDGTIVPEDPKPPKPGEPQALAVRPGDAALARQAAITQAFQGLIPSSPGEAYQISQWLAKSNVVPKALRGNPESCFAIMMAGLEIGLSPMRAVNNLTIISGNLAMKADLQLALIRKSGLLVFYDEGFEYRGQTDGDLATRAKDGQKILALVKTVPAGKPYGWCTMQRNGETNHQSRTFTWEDAERAFVYDDDGSGSPTRKKLSEKFNYVAWPQSMYPRRARTALTALLFSDVIAGIPAVEQIEGGQILEADFRVEPDAGDTEDQLMQAIREAGAELATTIEQGFSQLRFGRAKRLQKLVEYKGRPKDLVDWMKGEWVKQQGKERARPDVLSQPVTAQAPAEPQPDPAPQPAQEPVQEPERKAEPEQPMTRVGDLAQQFKKRMTF